MERHLSAFFLRFGAGVAASLLCELAAMHWALSIGILSLWSWLLIRAAAIATAWSAANPQQHPYSPQTDINREDLIIDAYHLALWAVPVAIGTLAWGVKYGF